VLKGAKYGKAVIHKGIKQQSHHLVLIMANRPQFKSEWSQLRGFKCVYSDNSYLQ